ncbi:hypothetical protein JXM67_10340 [candidate division WOR-3 bacterium]|nr:hypothetical protein [candidate division WOR-3 bacterium]
MNKHGMHHGSCCTLSHDCGCCHGFRRFYTEEEKREHLERYLESLKKEIKGVEEHLKVM